MAPLEILRQWAKRADVTVSVIDGNDVLRFGKGGARGPRQTLTAKPYNVPGWVTKRIATQRARLAKKAQLQRYD